MATAAWLTLTAVATGGAAALVVKKIATGGAASEIPTKPKAIFHKNEDQGGS
jgi:hypothetical protein